MTPSAISSSSSSDDGEAPESVSLARSKWNAQQDDDKIKRSRATQKQKLKTLNKERDKRLKERAANSRRKRRRVEAGVQDSAVQESEGEAESEKQNGNVSGVEADKDNAEIWGWVRKSETSEDGEEMVSGDENVEDSGGNLSGGGSLDALRLPDHLFAAASNTPPQRLSTKSARHLSSQRKAKKQMRASKSLILGSRVIQPLSSSPGPKLLSTDVSMSAKKVNSFVSRNLGYKEGSAPKGYERRPANIGILKSSGPAYSFVRKK